MKKRGTKPSEKAYTAMLTGLSSETVTKSPTTMKIADSVYRSIASPNSEVERSIIHTNAMLTVCHRHGDMDQLWRIIADIPEEGPNSPDTTTYTIILNAVQFAGRRDIATMSPDDIDVILQRKKQVITEGKRIWADIVWRWKNKTLELDDQVVSAMAGLLLDGASDMDCYNVLELYKQTMGIPILQKRPIDSPTSTRRRISREDQEAIQNAEAARQEQMEDVPFVDENNEPWDSSSSSSVPSAPQVDAELANVNEAEDFSELFSPVVPDTEGLEFLRPDSKELTHILSACFTMTQGLEGGQAYWSYLTLRDTPHRFEPDTYTYIQYFRLLRLSRSSKVCVKTMRDQMIPSGQATGLAFHLALSVCRRDRRNSSMLLHTNELMSLLDKVLVLPELRILDGYLSIIQGLADSPSLLLHLRGLDTDEASKSTKEKKKHSLPTLNRKFQVRLRLIAINVLRPYILQLHTALESVLGLGQLDGSPRYRGFPKDKESIEAPLDGTTAVRIMAHVRLLVDETLHLDASKNLITKAEREALVADSARLKKYSGRQAIEALQRKKIYPTPQQLQEGRQRIREYLGASRQVNESSWGQEGAFPRKAEAV
jgi:hypothetical protein